MASPATSSSNASPHPGPSAAGNGGQSSGSAQVRGGDGKKYSFLEAVPLVHPKIVPLEWSLPLIHHVPTETSDVESLRNTTSAPTLADDTQASGNTPSLSQTRSDRLPANAAADIDPTTPTVVLPPVPSPANPTSLAGAGQALHQVQKPWRIVWASYIVKDDPGPTMYSSAKRQESSHGNKDSVRSTPHSADFLQVPQNRPSGWLTEKPSHELVFDKAYLPSRKRAASDVSRRSSNSRASGHGNRKKRHHEDLRDLHADSPDTLLAQYHGQEQQANYRDAIATLLDRGDHPRVSLLIAAKKRFLQNNTSSRSADSALDMQLDQDDTASTDMLLRHGRLPQRLAFLDPGHASTPSKLPEKQENIPRLYTFSMTSPDPDVLEYAGLETSAFTGVELEGSGSFTASDLFPSLFNDNGIFTSPSSMHPSSIHPIPSAAALGAGQSPFFLSSLNISSSSNPEAIAASEAYLRAAEVHVLDAIQKSFDPNAPSVNDGHVLHTAGAFLPQNTTYGKGVRCGQGLLYASLAAEPTAVHHDSTTKGSRDGDTSTSPSSPFVSCQAHFTAADLRIAVRIQSTDYKHLSDAFVNDTSTAKRLAMTRSHQDRGRVVLLCPTKVPAIFLRWYGESSKTISRKQASTELAHISRTAPNLADLMEGYGSSGCCDLASERWALCALGNGLEIAWPASLLLSRPILSNQSSATSSTTARKRKLPSRIRSSMAKGSSRVSRKLYFRPLRDSSFDLVKMTVTHIELFNQDKKESRRIKAEKQLAKQASAIPASSTPIVDRCEQSKFGSSSLTNMDEPAPPNKPDIIAYTNIERTAGSSSGGLLNELGCATLNTVTAVLDSLLGSDSDSHDGTEDKPPLPGAKLDVSATDENAKRRIAEGVAVYPTPQSGPNSTNQTSLGTAESAEGIDTFTKPPSPGHIVTRPIADIFQDFAWPNYTGGSVLPQQVPSRPVSSSGTAGFNGTRGLFDDPSTFDFFDSGGLTEEDFSFFDSPMAADMALPQAPATFATEEAHKLSEITADEIASFVNNSGPIDHFGHLMPRSGHGIDVKADATENTFGLVADPSPLEGGAAPEHEPVGPQFEVCHSKNEDAVQAPEQEHAQSGAGPLGYSKYNTMIADPSLHESRQVVDTCGSQSDQFRTLQSTFGPIRFLLPSPPLSDDLSKLDDANNLVENIPSNNLNERLLRAARLRDALSAKPASIQNAGDLSHQQRDWQAVELLPDSSSDESIYASSDNSCNEWWTSTINKHEGARSPKPARMLSPQSLLQLEVFGRAPADLEHAAVGMQDRPKEGPGKINRGEKEAVATIFFQHTIENIDFRERQLQEKQEAPALAQMCLAQPLLGVAALSRKLALASPTEIAVYRQHALTTFSIAALRSWAKIGLKPHNGSKNVQAIIIAAKDLLDDHIRSSLGDWMHRVEGAWKVCGFGKHAFGDPTECVFALDCGASTFRESSNLQTALLAINASIHDRIAGEHSCIIYVLADDIECQAPSCNLMYLCLRLHLLRKGAIPHIIPLSSLASGTSLIPAHEAGSLQDSAMMRFAFNVYDRLPVCVTRLPTEKKGPNSVSALMPEAITSGSHLARAFAAPAFHLAPRSAPQVSLQLQWPPPALEVMEANRLLHIAYELSRDRKWLYLAAVDDRAEYNCLRVRFVEGFELRVILRRVWNFLKEVSECASVEWRICIGRLGILPADEVQGEVVASAVSKHLLIQGTAWCEILQNGVHQLLRPCLVTVYSVNQTASSTSTLTQQPRVSDNIPAFLSGINVAVAPDARYVDGQPLVYISHSPYPLPIYTAHKNTIDRLPSLPQQIYYALASSSIYFPKEMPASEWNVSPAGHSVLAAYKIDLLAVASHPSSSYNRRLASHMADLTQSFVDLYVMGKERWAMDSRSGGGTTLSHLPWHLASVSYMPAFDLESLLPA